MLYPLQSSLLASIPEVKHGFFSRQGGVSKPPFDSLNLHDHSGDRRDHVYENRRRVADWFGTHNTGLAIAHQRHTNQVIACYNAFANDTASEADGLVTSRSYLILAVVTADCVPVLFVEKHKRLVATCHAGWRGTLSGILQNTVQTLIDQGGNLQHVCAAIGPAIQQESYQVGHEIFQSFINVDDYYRHFFYLRADKSYQFDLPGLVYHILQHCGVGAIDWLKIDTYQNPNLFFSCRRNSHQGIKFFGDMVSGIMLQD